MVLGVDKSFEKHKVVLQTEAVATQQGKLDKISADTKEENVKIIAVNCRAEAARLRFVLPNELRVYQTADKTLIRN